VDEDVFKAIADPIRRTLLDRLFSHNGLTLSDLCDGLDITRFGVMKHLRVLESAGLVTTQKVGREKRHYLNPVPIRLIHDRWVSKYTAPMAAALVELKMSLEADAMSAERVQVYQIVIRTTPERLWQALTVSSFSRRYPFYMSIDSTFAPGAPIRFVDDSGRAAVDGTILESDPPRRLVYTWVIRYDAKYSAETSRVTWQIEPLDTAVCQLTLTHDVTNAPLTAPHVTGGWPFILSGIKTLLETGEPLVITR
jgi:uncharacterized protein YndB with AHSA1/START domain/DNA-binding transcriptional ArsR family regulator